MSIRIGAGKLRTKDITYELWDNAYRSRDLMDFVIQVDYLVVSRRRMESPSLYGVPA